MGSIGTSVLLVCLGNICRSPMAELVLEHKVNSTATKIVKIDSCGTAGYHIGSKPDSRTISTVRRHYGKTHPIRHRARQLCVEDFQEFDYILVMDESNYEDTMHLLKRSKLEKDQVRAKVALLAAYDTDDSLKSDKIHDPYYGGQSGFEEIFVQINRCIDGFLRDENLLQ